jgi:ABC-type amino acid transport substrate-binding protein
MTKENKGGVMSSVFDKFMIFVVCMLVLGLSACQDEKSERTQASAYDRVMKTGVIRAAYLVYPPALMKDTATGKMSGISVDTLETIASNLGLKVEWTEEVGWGTMIEGLSADRYDIMGLPVWANPTRGKLTTLSKPIYYSGIGIYVRADDKRFTLADGKWDAINAPDIRIATIDGETGDVIARARFPKAKRISFPQTTDITQLFLEVANNKADVFFAEPYVALQYYKHNPKNIVNIAEKSPIETLGNVYMMKANEFQFKHMMDVALEDLMNRGFIDEELAKYEGGDTFYKVALPYQAKN